jgi:hypothetical protein
MTCNNFLQKGKSATKSIEHVFLPLCVQPFPSLWTLIPNESLPLLNRSGVGVAADGQSPASLSLSAPMNEGEGEREDEGEGQGEKGGEGRDEGLCEFDKSMLSAFEKSSSLSS